MLFNRSMNKTLHEDELIIIFFSIIQDIIKTAGSFQRGFTPLPTLALSNTRQPNFTMVKTKFPSINSMTNGSKPWQRNSISEKICKPEIIVYITCKGNLFFFRKSSHKSSRITFNCPDVASITTDSVGSKVITYSIFPLQIIRTRCVDINITSKVPFVKKSCFVSFGKVLSEFALTTVLELSCHHFARGHDQTGK